MRFLKPKYVGKSRFDAEWHEAVEAYNRHLDSIRAALPESVRAFLRYTARHPLHDRGVERIEAGNSDELTIFLTGLRLELWGVQCCRCPEMPDERMWWLYEEVDIASKGRFVLRGLTDAGEIHVEAESLWLFDMAAGRYVIPDDPPPEPPKLFLDRRGPKSRKH